MFFMDKGMPSSLEKYKKDLESFGRECLKALQENNLNQFYIAFKKINELIKKIEFIKDNASLDEKKHYLAFELDVMNVIEKIENLKKLKQDINNIDIKSGDLEDKIKELEKIIIDFQERVSKNPNNILVKNFKDLLHGFEEELHSIQALKHSTENEKSEIIPNLLKAIDELQIIDHNFDNKIMKIELAVIFYEKWMPNPELDTIKNEINKIKKIKQIRDEVDNLIKTCIVAIQQNRRVEVKEGLKALNLKKNELLELAPKKSEKDERDAYFAAAEYLSNVMVQIKKIRIIKKRIFKLYREEPAVLDKKINELKGEITEIEKWASANISTALMIEIKSAIKNLRMDLKDNENIKNKSVNERLEIAKDFNSNILELLKLNNKELFKKPSDEEMKIYDKAYYFFKRWGLHNDLFYKDKRTLDELSKLKPKWELLKFKKEILVISENLFSAFRLNNEKEMFELKEKLLGIKNSLNQKLKKGAILKEDYLVVMKMLYVLDNCGFENLRLRHEEIDQRVKKFQEELVSSDKKSPQFVIAFMNNIEEEIYLLKKNISRVEKMKKIANLEILNLIISRDEEKVEFLRNVWGGKRKSLILAYKKMLEEPTVNIENYEEFMKLQHAFYNSYVTKNMFDFQAKRWESGAEDYMEIWEESAKKFEDLKMIPLEDNIINLKRAMLQFEKYLSSKKGKLIYMFQDGQLQKRKEQVEFIRYMLEIIEKRPKETLDDRKGSLELLMGAVDYVSNKIAEDQPKTHGKSNLYKKLQRISNDCMKNLQYLGVTFKSIEITLNHMKKHEKEWQTKKRQEANIRNNEAPHPN